jgi:tripartite-type tricarboxylate transporter receptor subunit TctC
MKFVILLFCALSLFCGLSLEALGQYPAKPLTLIIPFPPGGSTDIVGRVAAEGLSQELGQPIVVDNRAGAGGAIGAKAIADAAPDGYTLGLATVSTHVVNVIVRGDALRYDPLRDFTLISQIAAVPNVVSVHPGVPARNMKELLEYAKKNPGKLNYGSPGSGSLGHMSMETLKYTGRVDIVHVPYKGAGPALNDTLGGQVQVLYDNLPSSLPHIQAGRLRAIAVASEHRVASLPEVPTFSEVGLPMMNDPSWFGLVAPPHLPAEVTARLHSALVKTLEKEETKKRLEAAAATPVGNTPEQFRKVVATAIDNSRRVATEAKLKFD